MLQNQFCFVSKNGTLNLKPHGPLSMQRVSTRCVCSRYNGTCVNYLAILKGVYTLSLVVAFTVKLLFFIQ